MERIEIITQLVAAHIAAISANTRLGQPVGVGLFAVRDYMDLVVKDASTLADKIIELKDYKYK